MDRDDFHLIWLTGTNCDGCTVRALGDTSEGGLEALLTGTAAGLPRIRLVHPVLSPETGAAFVERLRRAERGELGPYGIVNEGSLLEEPAEGFYSGLGEEDGSVITFADWLARLARGAEFVVAWGDCAVWGGPHALEPNPTGATGTAMRLGTGYRSRLGLPVVNLPGCAPPHVLIGTLAAVLRGARGEAAMPELDETNRPRAAYPDTWEGAFVAWRG